jgi:hypothetical protein
MEGEVNVTSVENEGSTFTCSFKLQHEQTPLPLIPADNSFNKTIYYFENAKRAYLSNDYLGRISSRVHNKRLDELADVISTVDSENLIIIDIENGRQSREIHHHVMTLIDKRISNEYTARATAIHIKITMELPSNFSPIFPYSVLFICQ